jgi:hypothetical protein
LIAKLAARAAQQPRADLPITRFPDSPIPRLPINYAITDQQLPIVPFPDSPLPIAD